MPVPEPGPGWRLDGFEERLDAWAEREGENVDQNLILFVLGWVLTRGVDPYEGAEREPGFPNLWSAWVPEVRDAEGRGVLCSYWIDEATRVVRCDNYGLLS